MEWLEDLKKLRPCDEAITWAEKWKFKTLEQAWGKCKRGDWMCWLWFKHPEQVTLAIHRKIVLAVCEIARMFPQKPVGIRAIKASEAWTKNPTRKNMAAARAAADAAYAADSADAADVVSYYAARAADAAALKESAKIVRKHLTCPISFFQALLT